jgi:hypothetical protein
VLCEKWSCGQDFSARRCLANGHNSIVLEIIDRAAQFAGVPLAILRQSIARNAFIFGLQQLFSALAKSGEVYAISKL